MPGAKYRRQVAPRCARHPASLTTAPRPRIASTTPRHSLSSRCCPSIGMAMGWQRLQLRSKLSRGPSSRRQLRFFGRRREGGLAVCRTGDGRRRGGRRSEAAKKRRTSAWNKKAPCHPGEGAHGATDAPGLAGSAPQDHEYGDARHGKVGIADTADGKASYVWCSRHTRIFAAKPRAAAHVAGIHFSYPLVVARIASEGCLSPGSPDRRATRGTPGAMPGTGRSTTSRRHRHSSRRCCASRCRSRRWCCVRDRYR